MPTTTKIANINTVLLGVVIGLCSWTLREVHVHSTKLASIEASFTAQINSHTKEIDALAARLNTFEVQINRR